MSDSWLITIASAQPWVSFEGGGITFPDESTILLQGRDDGD